MEDISVMQPKVLFMSHGPIHICRYSVMFCVNTEVGEGRFTLEDMLLDAQVRLVSRSLAYVSGNWKQYANSAEAHYQSMRAPAWGCCFAVGFAVAGVWLFMPKHRNQKHKD